MPLDCFWFTPTDHHLLPMCWNNQVFVDTCLPFELWSAPKLFNIIADLLSWILQQHQVQYNSQLTPRELGVLLQETRMKLMPTCACGLSTQTSNHKRVFGVNNVCVAIGIYV